MVFYFSGTGNSKYVATTLSGLLSIDCFNICDYDKPGINKNDGEPIVFVFPVYSWGVPPIVSSFIIDLPERFWESIKIGQSSVNAVLVCGDEVALAPEMLIKILNKKGIRLQSIWSIIMPNNYVLLPGFDVDSKDIEKRKLENAPGRILEIARGILEGINTIDVVRGGFPWLKTKIVYPLFKKWGIFPGKWHHSVSCTGCGRCARICPVKNVKMIERKPEWGSRCCSCLGCYHICPVHAVEYGKQTEKKGQYFFPLKNPSDL